MQCLDHNPCSGINVHGDPYGFYMMPDNDTKNLCPWWRKLLHLMGLLHLVRGIPSAFKCLESCQGVHCLDKSRPGGLHCFALSS